MSKTEQWSTPDAPTASDAPVAEAAVSPVPQPSLANVPEAKLPVVAGPPTTASSFLKHFRIDRRLAAGGMGEVFLGYDTSLSRPVAIKTIRPELARDGTFLARFVREATAQANVVHPHVVQVYFVGEDRGQWFLAMQIVDGGSLHDALSKGGKMRWQDAARHMADVCDGLVVAEHAGIVHRDIKPANILLDREGRALLSDFGLAASRGTTDSVGSSTTPSAPSGSQLQLASVTQVGMVMGTPEYVAPEQLRIGPLDTRADIYALGATFFHLVTGGPAMPVNTLADAIARYESGARAPLVHTVAPDVPRAFAAVIDRCLEVDPAKRFATMVELRAALQRALPQPEVRPSPPLRALVWLLDTAPFILLSWATYMTAPWLGPVAFFIAGLVGLATVGSSPGIWLMRLRLRTVDDGDVTLGRGFARFLAQHGWYVPLSVGWSALYASSGLDAFFYVGVLWLAASVGGSLLVLGKRGQTLHDLVTKTRVLVDVRFR